ncbi:MFS general substrate transporter [Glonium stellatum]|uniref:MFS general substrate transporter n=1 Tax=Glonium stellatum TaxID=574774 RepID=A0A8E2F6R2_9PEZI|nr:MFS general substrate transporter [Glonium stellatum]
MSFDQDCPTASNAIQLNSRPSNDAHINTEAKEEEIEDESKYPSGLSVAFLTFGLCLATFTVALDNTIIATAIPKITTTFESLDDVGWYGSAYLLTTTALQPTFGKIYTFFDVKWTYIIALVIFEVGSIICATAQSSVTFIVGRAIAGVGGAALFSGGLTILALIAPMKTRPMYNSILTSMFGIASVVGPLLGGAFTDRLSWRWCFWVNLPFGGVAIAAVVIIFRMPKRRYIQSGLKEKIMHLDLFGAFLFISAIICLLLALQWGGQTYPWKNSRVWGCLLGFGLMITAFIVVQIRRGEEATIPPRVMKQRTVLASTTFIAFLSMGIYTHFYYLPFYFQAVKGTNAVGSGIRTIPYIVSITLAAVASGTSITAVGWYVPFMWFGASVFTVGAGMMRTLQVDTLSGKWIGYQVLAGVGAGAALQIPFVSVQCALKAKDMPTGNALVGFFNSLGAAISISVAQNIFSNTLVRQLVKKAPEINPATIINAGATHVREVTPTALIPAVLQAYNTAVTSSFAYPIAAGGVALFCSFFVEWKSVKERKAGLS